MDGPQDGKILIWSPPPDGKVMKALRFCNLLDDGRNILSPVKVNLWGANLAGISTTVATILAWVTGHWGMLNHITAVGSMVGSYVAGSHCVHHFDKRERNISAARMPRQPS